MNICLWCGWSDGYHSAFCNRPAKLVARPTASTTRIEWTDRIQVHHPVRTEA